MGSLGQLGGAVIGGIAGFFIGGPAGAVSGFAFGYTLGGLVFGIDLPETTKPNDEFQITGATEGSSPSIVFGKREVQGNVIFFGPVETQDVTESGKGSPDVVVGTRSFAAVHLTLALGPLRALVSVKDGKGRDWQALNASVGGSAFAISTGLGTDFAYDPCSAPLRGITTIFSPRLFMGENTRSMTPLKFIIDIDPLSTLGNPRTGLSSGVNPASVLWTMYVDRQWGRGLDPATLNLSKWVEAYEIFKNEDRGINLLESGGGSFKQYVEQILFHANAILRSGDGGLLELYPLRDNYVAVPVNETEISEVEIFSRDWSEVDNDLKASFPDELFGYVSKVEPFRNDAVINMTGVVNTREYNFEYFTNRVNVKRRLMELNEDLSFPAAAASFKAGKKFHKMRVGDVFALRHPKFGYVAQHFRVLEVEDPEFGDATMSFKCRQLRPNLVISYVPPATVPVPEPSIVDPLTVLDIGGLSDYWEHPRTPPVYPPQGVNGVDGIGDGPYPAGTSNELSPPKVSPGYFGHLLHLWAARGSGRDIAAFFETVVAEEADLPVAVAGRTASFRWAYKFTTLDRIEHSDYRYVLPGFPLRLLFHGFPGQSPLFPDLSDVDDNGFAAQSENGRWALLVGNTELWEFRSLDAVGSGVYNVVGGVRCVNKEYLYGWPIGTPVMLVDTRTPAIQNGMTYLAWAHRQRYVEEVDYADGAVLARIRTFAQSLDLGGQLQAADSGYGGPSGKTWVSREGGAKAHACNFYRPGNEAQADRGPFPTCQAFKAGGQEIYRKWYADVSLLDPSDWVIEFPPFPDDTTGAGDRIAYDAMPTVGQFSGPPVDGFEDRPKISTDGAFDAFVGVSSPMNGITVRLFIMLSIANDPMADAPVRFLDITFDGTETLWPAFVYTIPDQIADGVHNNSDLAFYVALVGRNGAFCRPRLAQKLGPYPPQTDPSLLAEPV